MRIGYLVSEYPAVSHTFIRREVEELRKRGIDIETFSIRAPARADWMSREDVDAFGSTFYMIPVRKTKLLWTHVACFAKRPFRYVGTMHQATVHRPPGIKGLARAVVHFAEAIYLSEEVARRNIDHLHNHFGNAAGTVCLLASYFLEIPWSFTIHGTSGFDYPAGLLLADKIRSAKFTACVSYFVRAQAQRCVEPASWGKLFINRCGVDMAVLPPAGAVRTNTSTLRILSVGRLSPEKAITGLIEAFADVRGRGLDVELHLIGDGPDRTQLEEQVERLGISASCRLLGSKSGPDVLKEMSTSDIFVMSSLMEGLPVVLMEALALGVPVVAPCVAGIPELVEHEVSGLLFVVSDWTGLANCLARLIADPDLRARLGRNGHQRVVNEFAIERAVEPIARFLADRH